MIKDTTVADAKRSLYELRRIACNTGPKGDFVVDPLVADLQVVIDAYRPECPRCRRPAGEHTYEGCPKGHAFAKSEFDARSKGYCGAGEGCASCDEWWNRVHGQDVPRPQGGVGEECRRKAPPVEYGPRNDQWDARSDTWGFRAFGPMRDSLQAAIDDLPRAVVQMDNASPSPFGSALVAKRPPDAGTDYPNNVTRTTGGTVLSAVANLRGAKDASDASCHAAEGPKK